MKKRMHRLLSLMLSLILVVGMIPGTMTAHAAETTVISYEVTDNAVIITATGKGEVKLYADGDDEPVNNPYLIPRGETEITVTFTATAKEEGKEISETVTKSVTVPAVQPNDDPQLGDNSNNNNEVNNDDSSLWWLWVLIAIVIVGGGITVFVFMKKKKQQ